MVIQPGTGTLSIRGAEAPQVVVRPITAARLERILLVTQQFFNVGRRGRDTVATTGPPASGRSILRTGEPLTASRLAARRASGGR